MEGRELIELAQDRDRWRVLVNAELKLRVHKMKKISWIASNRLDSQERFCSIEKVIFSVPVTALLKIFTPQHDPKSIINTFLTFTLILTSYWQSVYNWLLSDIQSVIDDLLTFSMVMTAYWRPALRNKTYNT